MQLATQKQGAVEITIDNVSIPGPWRALEGGRATSDDNRINPGHMLPAIALGGPPTRENITVRRAFDRDLGFDIYKWVDSRSGRGQATISRLFLTRDGLSDITQMMNYTGTLIECGFSNYDADSSDTLELELVFAIDGP